MDYKNLLIFLFRIGLSIKNFRLSLIFKGQDFSLGDNDVKVTEDSLKDSLSESDREKITSGVLMDIWNGWSLEEKTFYTDLKKASYIDSDKSLNTNENFAMDEKGISKSDAFLKKLRNIPYVGRVIAPVVNVMFSPTFARIIALAAAVAMLASPFGYVVGAVGMTIALTSLGYDVYRYVDRYRQLNKVKEETVLLDEIKKVKDDLTKFRAKNPELFDKLNINPKLRELLNPEKIEPKLINSMAYTLKGSAFNMAWGLATSIATLSPFAILGSIATIVTGYSVSVKFYDEFNKRYTFLNNVNNITKNELGLERGIENGRDNQYLSEYLSDLRAYSNALKSTIDSPSTKDESQDIEKLRKIVLDKFNQEPQIVTQHKEPTFLADAWKLISNGFNWAKINRLLTATLMDPVILNTHSLENYETLRMANLSEIESPSLVKQPSTQIENNKSQTTNDTNIDTKPISTDTLKNLQTEASSLPSDKPQMKLPFANEVLKNTIGRSATIRPGNNR